jgi:hypothetical protein
VGARPLPLAQPRTVCVFVAHNAYVAFYFLEVDGACMRGYLVCYAGDEREVPVFLQILRSSVCFEHLPDAA